MESMVLADEDGMSNVSAASARRSFSSRRVASRSSRQAIQLHGGIGVTDEHDIGLFFKRMHVLTTACGDEAHHVARYSRLMD